MPELTAREALLLWQQAGLLDSSKSEELGRYLEEHAPARSSGRMLRIFAALGAVLIGLGMILFVAGHWDGMRPLTRILTLLLGYVLAVGLALTAERKQLSNLAGALWLLVSLGLGANIFLIGQIFNLSLTFWQAPFAWMIGSLALAYATKSRLNAWLAVPTGLLALGWAGGGQGWFTDDQWELLMSPSGLKALFPAIGIGFASVGALLRGHPGWGFASRTWVVWGAAMIAVPLVAATVDAGVMDWIFAMTPGEKHWAVLAVTAVLLCLVLLKERSRQRPAILAAFAALGVILLALPLVGLTGIDFDDTPTAFYLAVIGTFVLTLGLVWAGARLQETSLINLGMIAAGNLVFIQYFSWSLRLLDRSLAFIIGGVLLIITALWIERKRRSLIRGAEQ